MEGEQTSLSLTYTLGALCAECLSHHRPDDPKNLHHCLIDGVWFRVGVLHQANRFCSVKCARTWKRRAVTPRTESEALALLATLKEISEGVEPKW